MKFSVKTLTGKNLELEFDGSTTVFQVKQKVLEMEGIALEEQKLCFAGKRIQDELALDSCGVKDESLIHLVHSCIHQTSGLDDPE